MPIRHTALALAAAFLAPVATAHDFWIEAETYSLPSPGTVALDILTGHGTDKTAWPVASHRVIGLRSLGPDGLISHVAGQRSLRADIELGLQSEGLHMLFIESTNSYSELPAEEFNAYVEEEGILPIAAHRLNTSLRGKAGRELYSRRGKALIKVGCSTSGNEVWSTPLGLSLEVIPLTNPFAWDKGEAFPLEVRFHGEALSSATLHVSELSGDGKTFTMKTGLKGRADLSGELTEGRWLVHTVWSEPAENLHQDADYQTVFSSFTFETETGCI